MAAPPDARRAAATRSPSFSITPLVEARLDDLAELYACECLANPAYRALFLLDTAEDAQQALRWFFDRRLRLLQRLGAPLLVAVSASDRVIGGVGLVPPSCHPGLADMLPELASLACSYGLGALGRLFALDRQYTRSLHAAAAASPGACELVMLATAADARRGGVGSALLRAAAEVAAGAPLVLGTNSLVNVEWYVRRGFEECSCSEVRVAGAQPFSQWTMRSDAARVLAATASER